MTQSTMRIHHAATPAPKSAPKQSQTAKQKPKTTNAYASSNQKHDEQKAPQRTADTPSDVLANAAAETAPPRMPPTPEAPRRGMTPLSFVHSHVNALSVFPLRAAARAGVPVRIAHSHSTAGKGEPVKNALKRLLRTQANRYPTHRLACSRYAGEWLFGKEVELEVVPNAIDSQAGPNACIFFLLILLAPCII